MPNKVVFLGEGRVGKTSLIHRFCLNKFDPDQPQTIGMSNFTQTIKLPDGPVTLDIWDTAGQEYYNSLGPIYYQGAKGAILVYDITDADSFVKVKRWIKELHSMVGPSIKIVICANKIDREKYQVVDTVQTEQYARSVGADHFYTSAKTGKGVKEVFTTMAAYVHDMTPSGGSNYDYSDGSSGAGQTLRIGRESVETTDEGGCGC